MSRAGERRRRGWWHALGLVPFASIACGPAPPARSPVIACIGDSITLGVTASPRGDEPPTLDALGGYPGRLQALVGEDGRIRNRGVGAATTGFWLAAPRDPESVALLARTRWRDRRAQVLPPTAPSVLAAVLSVDRPDIVVLLIGVNDVHFASAPSDAASAAAAGLEAMYRVARSTAPVVLVSTVLPNHRDPPAALAQLNAHIRAAHRDYLPLGERFAAQGWERLIDDGVHPNPAGYAVLAEVLAAALRERGLVASPSRAR